MKSLIIFVLCLTITWARPQRFPVQQIPNQGFINNSNNPFFPGNNNNANGNIPTSGASRFPIQQVPGPGFDGNSNNPFFPGNINNNNNLNNGNIATTTVAPGTATTASPQFLACLQSCPSTMEYNPICGTDNENYHNGGRLSCAQRCGKNVSALRMGTCQPL